MGLFGNSRKTYVGTSVVRVIEDKNIPDSPKTGLMKAILQNGNISDYVLEEFVGSIGNKITRVYNYAKDNYPLGVPTKHFSKRTIGRAEIQTILSTIHGEPVEIEYSFLASPNYTHFAWEKLINDFDYDTETNIINSISTVDAKEYLNEIAVVLPRGQEDNYSPEVLERWGVSSAAGYTPWKPSNRADLGWIQNPKINGSDNTTVAFTKIKYGKVIPATERDRQYVEYGFFNMELPTFVDYADYYQVCYTIGEKRFYWSYQRGLGVYPVLDTIQEEGTPFGSFLPFLYFRYEAQPTNLDKATPLYLTSTKMAKMLGMNYDEVIETINENPDIADVQQAMLTFAVPANTTNPSERKYLFKFFDEMYFELGTGDDVRPISDIYSFISRDDSGGKNVVLIQDAQFKMSLSNAGMSKKRIKGNIGDVGSYDSGFATSTYNRVLYEDETNIPYEVPTKYDYHYYRKQVSDTLIDEIRVLDLKMTYHIYGEHIAAGDDEGDILLVPIDMSIIEEYSIPEKEQLISKSMHMVFNSMTVVKLKWYQTGIFKALMIIVMIVITVLTWGANAPALAAALAVGGTVAIAAIWTMIIIPMLQMYVLRLGLQLFVKEFGADFAFLVAIVAVAYGMYEGFGDMATTWGETLLNVGNNLFKAVGEFYQEGVLDVYNELGEFNVLATDMYADLEKTSQELLNDQNNFLSPFVLFGEAPTDYYNRTVHSGNIGVQSFTAVTNYVDVALRLPTIDDTLKG